jgi:putative SOS response-associated peptidase YedK
LNPDELERLFGLLTFYDYSPRYNLAPSQPATVVRATPDGTREAARLTWGLVGPGGPTPWPNARWETAAKKLTFKDAIKNRRCLVPADGFIEWRTVGKKKAPIWFRLAGGRPFAFAGVWQPGPAGGPDTFTILTTTANDLVRPVHDRMPVMLTPDQFAGWIAPGYDPVAVASLCQPVPAENMTATPIDPKVNSWKNEGPELLRFTPPPAATGDLFAAVE